MHQFTIPFCVVFARSPRPCLHRLSLSLFYTGCRLGCDYEWLLGNLYPTSDPDLYKQFRIWMTAIEQFLNLYFLLIFSK